MKRNLPSKGLRPVLIAAAMAAVVAVAALVTPAGGASNKKLSKQIKQLQAEVAAIQKQQGPPGQNGQNGAAGTARAYATVAPSSCVAGSPDTCSFTKSKGVTSVTRDGGNYCVNVAGVDLSSTSA